MNSSETLTGTRQDVSRITRTSIGWVDADISVSFDVKTCQLLAKFHDML